MKTETIYAVVWGNERIAFERSVTKRISEGWQIHGGVAVSTGINHQSGATVDCFFQAMTMTVATPEPTPIPVKPTPVPTKKK